ncbi:unnamed protein product, partial [Iphiclides podalirius]
MEQIKRHYWDRFHKEYLSELQQRTKWREQRKTLKYGDLVVIKDDTLPPVRWRLGRVKKLYAGADGITRVADFTTARGVIQRALGWVCLPQATKPEDESLGNPRQGACLRARHVICTNGGGARAAGRGRCGIGNETTDDGRVTVHL